MRPAGLDQLFTFFFRPQGRIGRAEFALGVIFVYALSFAVLAFLLARTGMESGILLLSAVLTLPLSVALLVMVAKRCHDLGLPGTFLLLLFVPFVGLFWLVALCFIPGSAGPNAYGAVPQYRPD